MTAPVLFHVGYHKTGTTWLQLRLFTERYGYRQLADHAEISRLLVDCHGLAFDPADMRDLLARRHEETGDLVPVVSSEIMSGNPFLGGWGSDVFAHRIKAVAPEARILVTIRAQLRILPSVYMQYLLRGGTMSHQRFFEGTEVPGYWGFDARHFHYDRLVGLYQELFGAENVLVVTQEQLQSDVQGFMDSVAAFAGNPRPQALQPGDAGQQSPSYPDYAAPILRRVNHLQRNILNPQPAIPLGQGSKGPYKAVGYGLKSGAVRSLIGKRKPVADYVKSRFAGSFADSNRRLAEIVRHPLDLSRYE